jgi:hypothetical protein
LRKAGEALCEATEPTVSVLSLTLLCNSAATTSTSAYVHEACHSRAIDSDEGLQNIFEAYPDAPLSPFTRLICGGIAGITSVFLTYPLDIVRTRLSIQSADFAELGDRPKKLPGMWATMTQMYKAEGGMAALYRGIIPTVAGVAPYVSNAGLLISWVSIY